MTSRERVQATLDHREPDRIPIDFGSTAVTGIHVSCVDALRRHFGLAPGPVKVHEPYQMLGYVEPDLQEAMGLDADGVSPRKNLFGFASRNWKEWRMPDGLEVLVSVDFQTTVAENGDILIYPEGDRTAAPSARMPSDGYFFDTIIRQEPIEEESLNPEDNLEEFGPISDEDLAHIKSGVEEANRSGRAVVANFGGTAFGDIAMVPGPFLKRPKGIRDVAEWYMSTTSRRDYVHQIFARQTEIALENLAKVYAAVGNTVDVVFVCGTDFGTQTSSFCSVATFRDLYYPYYKQVNDWIHAHTTWKCFKHSCGSVEKFVPSMIESGFNVLNPVQCSATGMAADQLKAKYGDRLTFWGGGVDTQRALPFGTPEEVREQVLERCRTFGPGGGFVFNSIHNIQARTPVENILAMLNAVREYNGQEQLS